MTIISFTLISFNEFLFGSITLSYCTALLNWLQLGIGAIEANLYLYLYIDINFSIIFGTLP